MNDEFSSIFGRSFSKGETTLAELSELTKPYAYAESHLSEDLIDSAYDWVVVDGDLKLPSLDLFEAGVTVLVVKGDLIVEAGFEDSDYPATLVVVLSSFRARNVITSGALYVGGDLIVDEVLLGDDNDYSAQIDGHASAHVFIPEYHYFTLQKPSSFRFVLDDGAKYRTEQELTHSLEGQELLDALIDDVIDPDVLAENDDEFDGLGYDDLVDHDKVKETVRAGSSIVRN